MSCALQFIIIKANKTEKTTLDLPKKIAVYIKRNHLIFILTL